MAGIHSKLDQITPEQVAELHKAAVTALGRESRVALATGVDADSAGKSWWESHSSLIWDLAKSKGLVILGEQAGEHFPSLGGKLGGIVGWAIDLATSLPGDSPLPHARYIAAESGLPTPIAVTWSSDGGVYRVASWHTKRENAQEEADEYHKHTGNTANVVESYSTDPGDPD
jgi:hypothetical protein